MSHLFEWKRILEEGYRTTCYFLFLEQDEQWTGVLPLAHLRSRLAGNRLVSLPFLDQGGPIAESSETRDVIQEAALKLCRDLGARGVDLRGGFTGQETDRVHCTRYRFTLELGESVELWKRIGPKVRNQIRKSEKEGLETEKVDLRYLSEFFKIFSRNMHRLGSPVHSQEFFHSILAEFAGQAGLYVTYDRKGQAVAGGVAIRFRDVVTVPWASALYEARSSCPNHSLYWRVLRDAADEGAMQFDFGRSSLGTGTYRFKKQWGATLAPLVWRSFDPAGTVLMDRSLTPQKHSLLVKLWSNLPENLATRLGPHIRRHLSN